MSFLPNHVPDITTDKFAPTDYSFLHYPCFKSMYCLSTHLLTVVCISLETRSIAIQPSVAVGWVQTKVWSMPHLKGLTANFKLMS